MGRRSNSGFALLSVIFILVVLSILGVGIVLMLISGSRGTVESIRYDKAFYLANAGGNFAEKRLFGLSSWSGSNGLPLSLPLGDGCFIVSATTASATGIVLRCSGIVTYEGKSYVRSISAVLTKDVWGFTDDYVLYFGGVGSGGGTTTFGNNSTVNGGLYTSGSLSLGSGVTVNGNARAAGTITGGTVTGDKSPNTALPSNPPTINTSYYDNQLAIANGYSVSNKSWNNQTLSGTTYIHGNLSIANNKTITITGSALVVVTGTVTIGNGVQIGNNLTLISGGLLTINNSVVIGSGGTYYSTTGFSINNSLTSNFSSGQGTNYITPGSYAGVWNNATIQGFIYVGGTLSLGNNTSFTGNIVANKVSTIGNGSTLTLNSNITNFSAIQGISGGTVSKTGVWQEVY